MVKPSHGLAVTRFGPALVDGLTCRPCFGNLLQTRTLGEANTRNACAGQIMPPSHDDVRCGA